MILRSFAEIQIYKPSLSNKYLCQYVLEVEPRVDKVFLFGNNNMVPLVYISVYSSYIDEKLIKERW